MANQINYFFTDIGPNLTRDTPESVIEMNYEFEGGRPICELQHTNVEEASKLLKGRSNNKSTNLDKIPVKFLKLHLELSAKIITHIINTSIDHLTVSRG